MIVSSKHMDPTSAAEWQMWGTATDNSMGEDGDEPHPPQPPTTPNAPVKEPPDSPQTQPDAPVREPGPDEPKKWGSAF